jgi:hypothetical protein
MPDGEKPILAITAVTTPGSDDGSISIATTYGSTAGITPNMFKEIARPNGCAIGKKSFVVIYKPR